MLQDRRSFISMPKAIPGECGEPRSHALLYGADKVLTRMLIFQRNRAENRGVNRCCDCGKVVYEDFSSAGYFTGEWHHVRNKSGQRCDCLDNGLVTCRFCHKKRHVRVKF